MTSASHFREVIGARQNSGLASKERHNLDILNFYLEYITCMYRLFVVNLLGYIGIFNGEI